jgi:hypothetical protein
VLLLLLTVIIINEDVAGGRGECLEEFVDFIVDGAVRVK